MKNVRFVRLLSGEELICDVYYNNGIYTLKDVIAIGMRENPNKPGEVKAIFMKWLPYLDHKNGTQVNKEYVGFVAMPDVDLLNNYNRVFGGLALPQKSGLILPTT